MKEKLKKFIQNNTVKTVGLVLFTGVVTYYAAQKGIDNKMRNGGYGCTVNLDGYEIIRISENNEISNEEEA